MPALRSPDRATMPMPPCPWISRTNSAPVYPEPPKIAIFFVIPSLSCIRKLCLFKGNLAAQKLCGLVRYFLRVACCQKLRHGPRTGHFRAAGQIIGQTFGNQIGLAVYGHIRAKGSAEMLFNQRVVGAAQNGRLWARHTAQQRL